MNYRVLVGLILIVLILFLYWVAGKPGSKAYEEANSSNEAQYKSLKIN